MVHQEHKKGRVAMRKKLITIVLSLLIVPTLAFAQVREASVATISGNFPITNFGNIAVNGLDTQGNPGHIVMVGVDDDGDTHIPHYYLWVDETGDLCIASQTTLAPFASFPNGSWADRNWGSNCTQVGGQS